LRNLIATNPSSGPFVIGTLDVKHSVKLSLFTTALAWFLVQRATATGTLDFDRVSSHWLARAQRARTVDPLERCRAHRRRDESGHADRIELRAAFARVPH